MSEKTRKILVAIDILLILLTIGFIFDNSLEDVEKSTNSSTAVTETVEKIPPVKKAIEEKRLTFGKLEGIIRSLAHVAEFVLLGALVMLLLLLSKVRPLAVSVYMPFFFCLLVGIADECIQLTNDRACEVVDVIKDFVGSLIGGGLVLAIYGISYAVAKRKAEKKK